MIDKSEFDVVVVGGGISGLVTTALVAYEGYNVCLIEKESSLGGCIYSINKGGHNLQGGAHHLGGLGDGECVNRVLQKLGLYSKELFIQNNPLKGVVNNEKFYIPFELKGLKCELLSLFREESASINKFFDEVETFKEALITNNDRIIFKYFQSLSKITFNDLLDKYFTNNKIKTYLCGLGPGYGGITGNGSAFTMTSLLATYGEGAFNVKGGMDKLVNMLENYLNGLSNASIYTETLVEGLVIENEKVIAIKTTKNKESIEIGCKKIIITSNVINIYKMVNNSLYSRRFHNKINSLNVGPSVLRLFLSFDRKEVYNESDYVFFPSWDVAKWDDYLFYDTSKFNKEKLPISMVSFPTNIDKTLSKNDESHMFMTILTKSNIMNDSKLELKRKLKDMFFNKFPHISSNGVFDDIVTNVDIENKTLNSEGSVFGWGRGINEVVNSNIFGPTCMFKNLYVAGNWGPSFGVYGAFYSAENVMKILI